MGLALIERASELCEQIYGHLLAHDAVVDPAPADFVIAFVHLNAQRLANTGGSFPRDVVSAAFWYLVPPHER